MTHHLSRRAVLKTGTALAGGALVASTAWGRAVSWIDPVVVPAAAKPAGFTANRAPLAPQPFYSLPVGSVKPAGWLHRQLKIQADGLGGHLDETWDDVGPRSGWLGGKGESWERGPYFLDGLLPLAWLLDDPALKVKAQRFINWTLNSSKKDGMFGPASNDDWWPRMVMLKVLTQYHELTGDPRALRLMTDYFHHQLAELPKRPLDSWGMMRWQDNLLSVLWLYNRTGDAKLLQLANLLQTQGYRWQTLFANYPFKGPVVPKELDAGPELAATIPPSAAGKTKLGLLAHGVNNGQALKAGPVWSVVSGKAADRDFVHAQLATLDRYHGLPIGMFSGSEHLAGRSTSQGTELCTVAETLFSLECAMAITGSADLGDRIEKVAFNALPATLSEDMWSHQYLQQPNQVRAGILKGPWVSDGPESNMFGLEPNFGCCTANFHQAWPKVVSSLWMASADGGLAATVYAPCTVRTIVQGVPVAIDQATDYPFKRSVRIAVTADRPVNFPMRLRVPGWATAAAITVNGQPQRIAPQDGFARIDRQWKTGDVVDIAFTGAPRAVEGHNRSITFEDGPLVFAMPIAEDWQKLRVRGLTADWQIFPKSDWAYAVDPKVAIRRVERAVGPVPFSRRDPPVVLAVEARPVAGWAMTDGAADDVPADVAGRAAGKAEPMTLLPYGAPKLRLTAFANAGASSGRT